MKDFFRRLWEKMNEPKNERVLIILLPCLSIVIAALILLPRLCYYSAQRAEQTPTEAVAASAFDAPADQEAAVLPSSEVQPTPSPVQTPQPTPEPVYSAERGWVEKDGKLYNYDSFGRMRTGLQQVDGKLYYFGQDGAKARALGIDVSFYNKGID